MVSVWNTASTDFTWHTYKESFACHCVIDAKQISGWLCLLPGKPRKQKMSHASKQQEKKLKVKKIQLLLSSKGLKKFIVPLGLWILFCSFPCDVRKATWFCRISIAALILHFVSLKQDWSTSPQFLKPGTFQQQSVCF